MFYSPKVVSIIQTTKKKIDKVFDFTDKVHYLSFLYIKILQ